MPRSIISILLLFVTTTSDAQSAIKAADIEVTTQLTFIEVGMESDDALRQTLSNISTLSKKIGLDERFDWLTYEINQGKYLIVNFSNGAEDVLKSEDYITTFSQSEEGYAFGKLVSDLMACDLQISRHFLKEMIKPWSTVDGISVSEFPKTTLIEYHVPINYFGAFDQLARMLASLLQEVNYPYPLEGNRGMIGSYGRTFLVWFYDDQLDETIEEHLQNWMDVSGRLDDYLAIKESLDDLASHKEEMDLIYLKELSY